MKTIQNINIECVQGDISNQEDISAIVNATNAQLRTGGGVAGAIHRAAGPGLAEECRPLAPIRPGNAVISGAHNLPNDYVIHCLGPVYGQDKPEDKLLANCYCNALILAEENSVRSIAFPAISTGVFGYPMQKAAKIAFSTIKDLLPELKTVKEIRFVLYSEEDLRLHEKVMEEVL
ncbi:macro domain-containing protein [Gracilimonas amylolytica]|uniref:macro domain-containing protein n=1 Tax=Gracilimonas amylolytica TaxID=1749045 RepID=UPI000CD8E107|nr:macro domain-containing protein [Gracilimonas amylolytica]